MCENTIALDETAPEERVKRYTCRVCGVWIRIEVPNHQDEAQPTNDQNAESR